MPEITPPYYALKNVWGVRFDHTDKTTKVFGPVDDKASHLCGRLGEDGGLRKRHRVTWWEVCADSKAEAIRIAKEADALQDERFAYVATARGAAYVAKNHCLPRDITRRINANSAIATYGARNQRECYGCTVVT